MCILPGLIGILIFSVIPFIRVLYYSMIKNQFRPSFVFLDNYAKTLNNRYFQLALKNSLLLIIRDIPVMIIIALIIAVSVHFYMKKNTWILSILALPVVIPSAGVVVIWKKVFDQVNGIFPVDLLFIWKNTGLCIILISAALYAIPDEIYDAARVDGADNIRIHLSITVPIIAPTILFTNLFAIVSSFRIFKESYLYYGTGYPPEYAYTLQYYMNNNFLKLDYQKLATSSVYSAIISAVFIIIGMRLIKRYEV